MSSPDRLRPLRLAILLAAALPLAGCLQPLYAQRSALPAGTGGDAVRNELAAIDIVPVSTRVAQKVRNELIFRFTGGGEPIRPALYRMTISVGESVPQAVVDPQTGRIEIETVALNANYSVSPSGSNKAAPFNGSAIARASLTRSRQRFANVQARRDAEDRAALIIADQIQTQIAARFALVPPAAAAAR